MKVYITDATNEQERFKDLVIDSYGNQTESFYEAYFFNNPDVGEYRDSDGQKYYSMNDDTFSHYADIADKENEVKKLRDALVEELGTQALEIKALDRELWSWGTRVASLEEKTVERNWIARLTAFRLLDEDKLAKLGFIPDERLAVWAASNGDRFSEIIRISDQLNTNFGVDLSDKIYTAEVLHTLVAHHEGNNKYLGQIGHVLFRKPELLNSRNELGLTLLQSAICNSLDLADLLVSGGDYTRNDAGVELDVNALSTDPDMPGTALEINLKNGGDPDITKKLLDLGADVALGFADMNILEYVVKNGDLANLKVLLDYKPLDELCEITGTYGGDLLRLAANSDAIDASLIAQEIFKHIKDAEELSEVYMDYDEMGFSNIHTAIENKENPGVAKAFIDAWVEAGKSFAEENNAGETIYEYAVRRGDPEVAQYMLEKEPDLSKKLKDVKVRKEPHLEEKASILDAVLQSSELKNDMRETAIRSALGHFFSNYAEDDWPYDAYKLLQDRYEKEMADGKGYFSTADDLEGNYGIRLWEPYRDMDLKELVKEIGAFVDGRMYEYEKVVTAYNNQLRRAGLENVYENEVSHDTPRVASGIELTQEEKNNRLFKASSVEEIEASLEAGADINAVNRHGEHIIEAIAREFYDDFAGLGTSAEQEQVKEMVELVLDHGGKVTATALNMFAENNDAAPVLEAIFKKDPAAVSLKSEKSGLNFIQVAAANFNPDVLDVGFKHGADPTMLTPEGESLADLVNKSGAVYRDGTLEEIAQYTNQWNLSKDGKNVVSHDTPSPAPRENDDPHERIRTGYKDSKGKAIYVGDIVYCEDDFGTAEKYTVVMKDGRIDVDGWGDPESNGLHHFAVGNDSRITVVGKDREYLQMMKNPETVPIYNRQSSILSDGVKFTGKVVYIDEKNVYQEYDHGRGVVKHDRSKCPGVERGKSYAIVATDNGNRLIVRDAPAQGQSLGSARTAQKSKGKGICD